MKKLIILVVLFIALLTVSQVVLAQDPAVIASGKPGWHKIGEVKADFKLESESIVVFGKDKFKSIKLKVTDAAINLNKVVVYYEDDKTQEIPVSGVIASGNETRVYELLDPGKEIKKVLFTYKSEPNYADKKAHVELYGLK